MSTLKRLPNYGGLLCFDTYPIFKAMRYCLLFFIFFINAAHAAPDWNPKQTYVFVVGVLEWERSEKFPSFDKKGRIDAKIVDFFRQKGVPASQIVYLQDTEASTRHVQERLGSFLQTTTPESTLIYYYCGHGYRNQANQVCFANYSGANWPVEEIVATIDREFAGKTVLFTADCCNSGALAVQTARYKNRNFAALCSVVPTNVSTGNWTFSNALLSGLQGQNYADTDTNRKITLQELATYINDEMAIVEGQKANAYVPENLKNWTLTDGVATKSHPRVGERVNVNYDGKDWLGFVIDAKESQFNVRFYSYTNNETDWIAQNRAKPLKFTMFPIGATVEVYSAPYKAWYPAKVLRSSSCLHYIHYIGYGDEWDEWAAPQHIRKGK